MTIDSYYGILFIRSGNRANLWVRTMHATTNDPVRAWFWYSLADRHGEPKAAERLTRIAAGLSPEQVEEAKQELTTWKPGQCMQDLATDQQGQDVE